MAWLDPVPPEKEYINVDTGERIHPFLAYKYTTPKSVEVVNVIADDQHQRILRQVYISNGTYKVWVRASAADEYGYPLQPEERLPDEEFAAVRMKQDAMGRDPDVTFDEVCDAISEADSAAAAHHLAIAAYYALKRDPKYSEDVVERFHDVMEVTTGHVDFEKPENVRRVLADTLEEDPAGSG